MFVISDDWSNTPSTSLECRPSGIVEELSNPNYTLLYIILEWLTVEHILIHGTAHAYCLPIKN